MKKCNSCGDFLSINMFHKAKTQDGVTGSCKSCINKKTSEYKKTKEGAITSMYANQKYNSKARGYEPPMYTKEELKAWLMSQDLFHELYDRWVDSGYLRDMKPSVDRIDDYETYRFGNIQLMTWKENRDKGIQCDKKYKPVLQFSMDGLQLACFRSMKYAVFFTDASTNGLIRCCKGRGVRSGSYKWAYAR